MLRGRRSTILVDRLRRPRAGVGLPVAELRGALSRWHTEAPQRTISESSAPSIADRLRGSLHCRPDRCHDHSDGTGERPRGMLAQRTPRGPVGNGTAAPVQRDADPDTRACVGGSSRMPPRHVRDPTPESMRDAARALLRGVEKKPAAGGRSGRPSRLPSRTEFRCVDGTSAHRCCSVFRFTEEMDQPTGYLLGTD